MTLTEAYEAILKLHQTVGDNDVCDENGKALYPLNPASQTVQNTLPVFWQDLMLASRADC